MAGYELRPLSLGEVLDRTFSLYRRNFLLFAGITAIPELFVLALNLSQFFAGAAIARFSPVYFLLLLVSLVVAVLAYLISQGGTVLAVSDIYLGREASIGGSLRRAWSEVGSLFGVVVLNGLACLGAALALIVPGVYLACRLLVCVPSALIEQRGPRESLSRSFQLTRDYAGRAFVIVVLYFVIVWAANVLFAIPFAVAVAILRDPERLRPVLALSQIADAAVKIATGPILLIATSVYYYDLRVRKEAFDLQFMMDPTSEGRGGPSQGIPSILS